MESEDDRRHEESRLAHTLAAYNKFINANNREIQPAMLHERKNLVVITIIH